MKMDSKTVLLQKQKGKINLAAFLMALSVAAGILPILLIMQIVGELMSPSPLWSTIQYYLILMFCFLATKGLIYALALGISHIAAYQALADIRLLVVTHLKKLPLGFFQKRRSGELTKIINHDVEQIELLLAHVLPDRFAVIAVATLIFGTILFLDWRLGLAMLTFLPLFFVVMLVISGWWKRIEKQQSQSLATMSSSLMEFISTIPVIKAFSREEKRTALLYEKLQDYQKWATRQINITSLPIGGINILLEAGLGVLVIAGSIFLMGDQISIEKFFIIFILGNAFFSIFSKLYFITGTSAIYQTSVDNINSILEEKPLPLPVATTNSSNLKNYDIVFKEINFAYEKDRTVLENINLTIPQKAVTAFIGRSGSGKSTLTNLIMRFWLPTQGEITIGAQNITEFKEEDLSGLISMVHQDVYLFNTTIAENIRLGKHDATEEEVVAAAKKARIHDFVMSLPGGYQTITGEKGARLSGGEKQRLSIARTILKDAPIIILDEATASVDPYNERLIHEAIRNLTQDKTLIVVAHHLDTIMHADQIVLLDKGKIVACGTHEQLLSEAALYRHLWQDQDHIKKWGLGTR